MDQQDVLKNDRAYSIAASAHEAGDLRRAELWYRKLLEETPDESRVLSGLGLLLSQTGRQSQGVEFARRAVQLAPAEAEYQAALGGCLFRDGQHEEAEATFRKLLVSSPSDPRALHGLGAVLARTGKISEAEQSYQRGIDEAPDNTDLLTSLAELRRSQGRFDDAIELCQRALSHGGEPGRLHYALGVSFHKKQDWEAAVSHFTQAAHANPAWAEALLNLGHCYEQRSQFDFAIASYRRALSLQPQDQRAAGLLKHLLDRLRSAAALSAVEPATEDLVFPTDTLACLDLVTLRLVPATARIVLLGASHEQQQGLAATRRQQVTTLEDATKGLSQNHVDDRDAGGDLRRTGGFRIGNKFSAQDVFLDLASHTRSMPPLPAEARTLITVRTGQRQQDKQPPLADADDWVCTSAWAARSGGGWFPVSDSDVFPLGVQVWQRPSSQPVSDSFPDGQFRALFFDWQRGHGNLHQELRATLGALGVIVNEVPQQLVETLAAEKSRAAVIDEVIRHAQPVCVVVEATCAEGQVVAERAAECGAAVLILAADEATATRNHAGEPGQTASVSAAECTPQRLAEILSEFASQEPRVTKSDLRPLLSVIVPTYNRSGEILRLLQRLALQDLPPAFFEVVIADDGSPQPVAQLLAGAQWPFPVEIVRGQNAGPATARNRAIPCCRGQWAVIYNDDALPAPDNLRRHLTGQQAAPSPTAILGTFDFEQQHLTDNFTRLLQHTKLLFEYHAMRVWGLNGSRFFYTPNISLPLEALRQVDGFDGDFPDALCEDVELGIRLEELLGLQVYFDPRIRADHDHQLTLESYIERAFKLGVNEHRIWCKHDGHIMPGFAQHEVRLEDWLAIRTLFENTRASAGRAEAELRRRLSEPMPPGSQQFRESAQLLRNVLHHQYHWGLVTRRHGWDAGIIDRPHKLHHELTSIIVPNLNGTPHLQRMVQSLRATTSGPYELIVVDNGSSDGSLQWLQEQPDIRVVSLSTNRGAPTARNRGLLEASGKTLLFCDNDVVFTAAWRERMLRHLTAWPDIGCVGPMSNQVAARQKTTVTPNPGESLAEFAERFYQQQPGDHHYFHRLIAFCMLVRREVIDRIGGFDERFNPWGFEDDDFALRSLLAGFPVRIARDVFIYHAGSQSLRTADLNRDKMLLENWQKFKHKWGIDPTRPYGRGIWDLHEITQPNQLESLQCRIGAPSNDA